MIGPGIHNSGWTKRFFTFWVSKSQWFILKRMNQLFFFRLSHWENPNEAQLPNLWSHAQNPKPIFPLSIMQSKNRTSSAEPSYSIQESTTSNLLTIAKWTKTVGGLPSTFHDMNDPRKDPRQWRQSRESAPYWRLITCSCQWMVT